MIVRTATEADIPQLLAIAQEFISESNYGWEYCEPIADRTFRLHMQHPESVVLVGKEEGEITSCAILCHDRDFVIQRLGYFIKFYVRPKFRGTLAARSLVQASNDWFREQQCWAVFVTATANIGASSDKQFANLFRKFGFVECGPTLMKDMRHE